jgi:hypothetical protein
MAVNSVTVRLVRSKLLYKYVLCYSIFARLGLLPSPVERSCVRSNGSLCSIKDGKMFDWRSDCLFQRRESYSSN